MSAGRKLHGGVVPVHATNVFSSACPWCVLSSLYETANTEPITYQLATSQDRYNVVHGGIEHRVGSDCSLCAALAAARALLGFDVVDPVER